VQRPRSASSQSTLGLHGYVRALSSHDPGLFGQGLRFAIAGGIVSVVYVAATVFLSSLLALPFEVALVIAFSLALATHFTLQRTFVWVHQTGYVLAIQHQARRYLAIALTQYGITAAATATLPRALGVAIDVIYVTVTAIITVANFLVFRTHVFHTSDQNRLRKEQAGSP